MFFLKGKNNSIKQDDFSIIDLIKQLIQVILMNSKLREDRNRKAGKKTRLIWGKEGNVIYDYISLIFVDKRFSFDEKTLFIEFLFSSNMLSLFSVFLYVDGRHSKKT